MEISIVIKMKQVNFETSMKNIPLGGGIDSQLVILCKIANIKLTQNAVLCFLWITMQLSSSCLCPDRGWAGLGWAGLSWAGDSSQFSELMKNEGSILTGHWTPADVKRPNV